ncbi:tRNA lysidine(34) synthetase TilS [Paenibacillus thailandensis]|uniref:tRNA(Ile)-lysidine synthase n=1 Tax=Paenibacillus thailandensis TaxID=393250 RepID=A0ABW5R190_9BACL
MGNREDERLRFLRRTAAREKLWKNGDKIVVAVSGGPDSMALLHMLSQVAESEGISLVAAHANHGFRPESAEEAVVVQSFSERLGVECEQISLNMPAYIEETGMNGQEASRLRRYVFLHETAARHGAGVIALAHHADDQAETVMMRIIRGTGLGGLAAIAMKRTEKNVELIRPLLRMKKTDLLQYCSDYDIPYCLDGSNEKRDYFRNVVRLDVLPYLSQFNPQLPDSLWRLAELASSEDDWMDREAKRLFDELASFEPEGVALQAEALNGLHVALQRRLIKLILNYLSEEADSVTFDHIETIRAAAAPGARSTWRLDAGGGVRFLREYGRLSFIRPKQVGAGENGGYAYEVPAGATRIEVKEFGSVMMFAAEDVSAGRSPAPAGREEACFDIDKLKFPLVIRSRKPGDRMQILGLNGSKKVQDMFVDGKVPPSLRERYPLLCDAAGRLLWVPGIRRSGHALVERGKTKGVLRVRIEHE